MSAFLPPFCICHNLSVTKAPLLLVTGQCWSLQSFSRSLSCTIFLQRKKEERLMHEGGNTSPQWFVLTTLLHRLPGYGVPVVRAVGGFLIVLNPEWTINDIFLTWAELKFVFVFLFFFSVFVFFITLIFLFKWIPMDCVTIWFMQLCWNEKRLRL